MTAGKRAAMRLRSPSLRSACHLTRHELYKAHRILFHPAGCRATILQATFFCGMNYRPPHGWDGFHRPRASLIFGSQGPVAGGIEDAAGCENRVRVVDERLVRSIAGVRG